MGSPPASSALRTGSRLGRLRGRRAAEVRLDDLGIAANLVRRPGRDHLAELEHDDAVADRHHQPHVVIDQERCRARVRDASQPLPEILALAGIEPGRGLVEAEQAGSHRDCPRHADELPLTLRQLSRHRVRDADEVEQPECLLGRLSGRDSSPDDLCGEGQERGPLRSHSQVLAHREVVEQLRALPRPREAAPGAGVRRQSGEIPSVELDHARVANEAGDRVDEGRLAGAVGTDQADELSLLDGEIDAFDCVHAAETDREAVRREDDRHVEAASARLRCRACAVR